MPIESLVLAWLPFIPLISFLLLILFGKKLTWLISTLLSVGSLAFCTIASAFLIYRMSIHNLPSIDAYLWTWFSLASGSDWVDINIRFVLDSLSAVMISVVSGVGLLIHIFAAAYMKTDENFSRFMAYMNLFIVAMMILVLADNLVLLYLGWEGVGLCSFLLIGFWYHEKANVLAARKAFIVTRIGDTSLAIGLFLLFQSLGQLTISDIASQAPLVWVTGDTTPYWIALLLLGGAVGKSAQLPLHTWLPDAMAGPTPVSALIHAATMVTAGVYLIARMNSIFILSPDVMQMVAWIGAITLVLAGFAALAQSDIKRILAYSTMSQIGYMMLALGAGAWSEGIFHLMTHAFFKALLFLTAGAVILALHHEQNIFKMGGLSRSLKLESRLFLIGLICLMALPGTSGFFSKEAIINGLWSSPTGGAGVWWFAILGALLTSIYSCRLFILAFLGRKRTEHLPEQNTNTMMRFTLIFLAILALFGGAFSPLVADNLASIFPLTTQNNDDAPHWLHGFAILTPFVGMAFSWFYFQPYLRKNRRKRPRYVSKNEIEGGGEVLLECDAANQASGQDPAKLRRKNSVFVESTARHYVFAKHAFGFDWLYNNLLVKPYCFIAKLNRLDIVDQVLMLNARYIKLWHEVLRDFQNGYLRWYAASIGLAVIGLIGVIVL